jgi:hypothetical protein
MHHLTPHRDPDHSAFRIGLLPHFAFRIPHFALDSSSGKIALPPGWHGRYAAHGVRRDRGRHRTVGGVPPTPPPVHFAFGPRPIISHFALIISHWNPRPRRSPFRLGGMGGTPPMGFAAIAVGIAPWVEYHPRHPRSFRIPHFAFRIDHFAFGPRPVREEPPRRMGRRVSDFARWYGTFLQFCTNRLQSCRNPLQCCSNRPQCCFRSLQSCLESLQC